MNNQEKEIKTNHSVAHLLGLSAIVVAFFSIETAIFLVLLAIFFILILAVIK